jgi:4-hydroxybenzoate polyprenyltransferase
MQSGPSSSTDPVPLCVDLDGTLIRVDTLPEMLLHLLRNKPLRFFQSFLFLWNGRAPFKRFIARHADYDFSQTPVCPDFLTYLAGQQALGRQLVLVTAADSHMAQRAAAHFGFFGDAIGSDGSVNLKSRAKAEALVQRYGEKGFDYAGNERADFPVWRRARTALLVNATPSVTAAFEKLSNAGARFSSAAGRWRVWIQAFRIHQWIKNILVFVPLVAAHQWKDEDRWMQTLAAFAAFSLAASAMYIFNDLLDLEADRHHPLKKNRPFASGRLQSWHGLIAAGFALGSAFVVTLFLPPLFSLLLGIYLATTLGYSLILKSVALVDVFTLAGLYTLRLVGGGLAADVPLSSWMLGFYLFVFLSLALAKRCAELELVRSNRMEHMRGRGYHLEDWEGLAGLGATSGMLSTLVVALYINSPEVARLYAHPSLIWLVCPLFLFWICRVWFLVRRGDLHDDPIVFALTDRTSYVIAAALGIILYCAKPL